MREHLYSVLAGAALAACAAGPAGPDESSAEEPGAEEAGAEEAGAESAPAAEETRPAGAAEAPRALAGCETRSAGGGFGNWARPLATTLAITDLEATPALDAALDGVLSLSSGPATSFNHLATAVRFSTAGVLDVRDGSAYRADAAVPFTLGQARKLRIVADLPSHTFSVYVEHAYDTVRLARRYAFRPTTAAVTGLDNLAAIVDGPAGQLTICNAISTASAAVAYSREGSYGVVPLASDQALVSDGATVTMRLSATGAVLNQIAVGGELAADPSGRAYVVRASGGQLAISAYTAALAARWGRTDPAPAGTRVIGAAASASALTLALAGAGGGVSIVRYPAAGGAGTVLYTGGTYAAVAADGFAVATTSGSTYQVTMFALDGTPQWTQSFPSAAGATIEVMTLELGGRVAIGGHFSAPISFGGPVLTPIPNPGNTYLVGLDRATGAHVFTYRLNVSVLTGAAGNGARLAVSGERWVMPIFPDLYQFDASGAVVAHGDPTGLPEQWGRSGRVAIGASNRVYWERSMRWPNPTSREFPYLYALRP